MKTDARPAAPGPAEDVSRDAPGVDQGALAPELRRYLEDPRALSVPWVESPFFEQLLASRDLTPRQRQLARTYHDEGYVILEDVVPLDLVDRILSDYPRLFDPGARFEKAPREQRELLRRDPGRKQDAWFVCEPVRELAALPALLDVLRLLYGREPIPFQTLNFLPGTQQPIHSDAMHFSSVPARFLCGIWVALEDVTADNGPLQYIPGSHRFSEVQLESLGLWGEVPSNQLGETYRRYELYLEALVRLHGLPVRELTVPKGSALVWAANLLHGGAPIRAPGSTRRSQVTHYYFEDCVYYTPIFSNAALGELFLRTVHDLRTGEHVPHRLNGRDLEARPARHGRSTLRPR